MSYWTVVKNLSHPNSGSSITCSQSTDRAVGLNSCGIPPSSVEHGCHVVCAGVSRPDFTWIDTSTGTCRRQADVMFPSTLDDLDVRRRADSSIHRYILSFDTFAIFFLDGVSPLKMLRLMMMTTMMMSDWWRCRWPWWWLLINMMMTMMMMMTESNDNQIDWNWNSCQGKTIDCFIVISGRSISFASLKSFTLPSGRERLSSEFTIVAEMEVPLYQCSVANLLFCSTTPVIVECECRRDF